ncbi:hypothetical protein RRG08_065524 [Elysia crispata]|uniref:Uncharacterized protein n=1 Tax=Elysia crispata TaxID=231223 RepID=A0AAE0YEL2_9GAST|nr:hypothetical protein RRG08_065524 [Elysia crispata]
MEWILSAIQYLRERINGPPRDQFLDLRTLNSSSDSPDDRRPSPSWEDSKALLRCFLRKKEAEYKTHRSYGFRYIYIVTDRGADLTPLHAHVENFFHDNGYK